MDIENWINLSVEEICGRFEEIKINLNEYEFLNINSPDDLVSLKDFILKQLNDGCFKSERHKLAYLLSKYESGAFNDELGIKRRHFVDEKLAKRWLGQMQAKFHPDKNQDIKSDINFTEVSEGINRAYGEMVGRK